MVITKPVNGDCDTCGKKNCLVQTKLLFESRDAFDDRTNGKGDYDKDKAHYPVCRACFVDPREGCEWDEDVSYTDPNQRDAIWKSGDWQAQSP